MTSSQQNKRHTRANDPNTNPFNSIQNSSKRRKNSGRHNLSSDPMTVEDKKSKKFNQNNTLGDEDTFPVKGEDSSERAQKSPDTQITSIVKGDFR